MLAKGNTIRYNNIIISIDLFQKIISKNNPKEKFKMLSITKSMTLHGLQGFLIDVQVDVSAGMPAWDVVGLPDISVREAK